MNQEVAANLRYFQLGRPLTSKPFHIHREKYLSIFMVTGLFRHNSRTLSMLLQHGMNREKTILFSDLVARMRSFSIINSMNSYIQFLNQLLYLGNQEKIKRMGGKPQRSFILLLWSHLCDTVVFCILAQLHFVWQLHQGESSWYLPTHLCSSKQEERCNQHSALRQKQLDSCFLSYSEWKGDDKHIFSL